MSSAPPLVRAWVVTEVAVRKASEATARIHALADELFAVADARDRWLQLAMQGAIAVEKIREREPARLEEEQRQEFMEETPGEREFAEADAAWYAETRG